MTKKYSLVFFFILLSYSMFSQTDSIIASGFLKQKAVNYSGALADFSTAIKKNEDKVSAYINKLDSFNRASLTERSEKGVDVPIIDIDFARPYFLRGMVYLVINKNEEAINDFTFCIKINPKMESAYYQRGKTLWSIGKKDESCFDLGIAGQLKDSLAKNLFDEHFCWKNAEIAYKAATSKFKFNEFQEAISAIEIAIKLCPDSVRYLVLRGRSYFLIGKYELSMIDFNKAISISQTNFEAYYDRGVALLSTNKYQEAFDDFTKALSLNDRSFDSYLNRAMACQGMQKNTSALYDYQKAQHLQPNEPLAFYKSGLLKIEMGDKAGGCADFTKAANLGHKESIDSLVNCKGK